MSYSPIEMFVMIIIMYINPKRAVHDSWFGYETRSKKVLIPHDFLPCFRFTHLKHIQHGDSYEGYLPKNLCRDKKRWVPMDIQLQTGLVNRPLCVPVWKAVPGRFAAQGGLGGILGPAPLSLVLFTLLYKNFHNFVYL